MIEKKPNSQEPMEDGFRESELGSKQDVTELHASTEREPVSVWLIVLIMVIMFGGGMFLFANSGGFQSNVYNANAVSWSGAGSGGPAAPPDPMVVGKRIYTRNCAVCHQSEGQGVAGQFPPLAGSEWVISEGWHGDNHIVQIVLDGLHGPVTVDGKTYNNAMAPWGTVLKDAEIAAVLTYVRNSWGNEAPAIPVEFVADIRSQDTGRKDPWTEKELQATERVLVGAAPAAAPAGEAKAGAGSESPDAAKSGEPAAEATPATQLTPGA